MLIPGHECLIILDDRRLPEAWSDCPPAETADSTRARWVDGVWYLPARLPLRRPTPMRVNDIDISLAQEHFSTSGQLDLALVRPLMRLDGRSYEQLVSELRAHHGAPPEPVHEPPDPGQ